MKVAEGHLAKETGSNKMYIILVNTQGNALRFQHISEIETELYGGSLQSKYQPFPPFKYNFINQVNDKFDEIGQIIWNNIQSKPGISPQMKWKYYYDTQLFLTQYKESYIEELNKLIQLPERTIRFRPT